MKKIILFLALTISLYSQGEPQIHGGELIIELLNRGSSWNVTFTCTAVSAKWDENYELTADYTPVSVTIPTQQYPLQYIAHFDLIIDIIAGNNPIVALGLYKISAIEGGIEKAFFYMDWRTNHSYSTFGSADVYFKYDYANKRFRDANNTQTIDGTYQTNWDLVEGLELITLDLEDYWGNALAVFKNHNNYPQIAWGPYNEDEYIIEVTNYEIHRKYGGLNWQYLTTVSSDVFTYEDQSLSITGVGGTTVQYKIRAVQTELPDNLISEYSNIVSILVDGEDPGKLNFQDSQIIQEQPSLMQNYPNPFNPSTQISWILPLDNFVNLTVFDVLGREVATLANEYQNAGEHSIEFNANDLSSGVYIYRIQIGEYIQSRSFILQK